MILRLLDVIRREKLFSFLFLVTLLLYVWAYAKAREPEHRNQTRIQRNEIQQTWDQFEAKTNDPASLQAALKKSPFAVLFFQGVVFFILMILVSGFIFNYRLFFEPSYRDRFRLQPVEIWRGWCPSLFFKSLILFFLTSFVWVILLGILKKMVNSAGGESFYVVLHTLLSNVTGCVVIGWMMKPYGGSWKQLGWVTGKTQWWEDFKFSGTVYAAIFPWFILFLILLADFATLWGKNPEPHPLSHVFLDTQTSPQVFILSLLAAVALGPALEEIFFRGFCYGFFKKQFGMRLAMVLSASIFAFVHANWFAFWPVFFLGLALAYVYEKRQSIVAPMILHILHNSLFIGYLLTTKAVIESL